MKIGDTIICIKTRDGTANSLVTKGKKYNIMEMRDNSISTSCNESKYYIRCHFILYGNTETAYIFSEFFMTIKEMRLNKLKNINEKL